MVRELRQDMENKPLQDQPKEEDIEDLLRLFKPQPTARFYKKMSAAPWQKRNTSKNPWLSDKIKIDRKIIWAFAVIGFVGVMLIIAFIPSARVVASQIIHLFLPAPSNQLDVQVTLSSPGDFLDFSAPENFPLIITEVQRQVSFKVKEISLLPAGLTFIGSRYDPSYNAVTLLYSADSYKLFLTQRLIGNGQDVFSIGASANVIRVKIGIIDGEFVKGGWNAITTQTAPDHQPSPNAVDISAIWDNELPQSTLRWQASDIVYELRINGNDGPSQSELINIANELK